MTDKKPKNKKSKSQRTPKEEVKNCSPDSHYWPLMGMGLAVLIIILDQISKWVVLNHFMVPPQTLPVTSFFDTCFDLESGG